jgi:hypothetical protein
MRSAANSAKRFPAWFLAAVFLAAQGAALAHEYDHALAKHDAPCAQHVFANHLDKVPAAKAPAPAVALATHAPCAAALPAACSRPLPAYQGRAPPRPVSLIA